MSRTSLLAGRASYWLTLPALMVYLRIGKRTRVLVCVGDEFLVVKGWLGSGKWQLPGGGLHSGEVSVTGALRELHEETGLQPPPGDLTLLQAEMRSKGWLRFRFDAYLLQLPHKPTITLQAGELVDYTWLPVGAETHTLTSDTSQVLALLAP